MKLSPDMFIDVVQQPLAMSIIIPTMNECDNIVPLLNRLNLALTGIEWEVVFVDDGSTDKTRELIAQIAATDRRVRLIYRLGRRGLASAVIEGMLSCTAPVLAVMDADLQHDENILSQLYHSVKSGGAHLAVGTRYANGGSTGAWSQRRVAVSSIATRLASRITGTDISDPMSGFFALDRRFLLEVAPKLSGVGYKILLDVISSSKSGIKISEIPYTFRNREFGESKLDTAVVAQYIELLVEKSVGRWIPVRFLKFCVVGTLGLSVHMALLYASLYSGAAFTLAQAVAVVGAMSFNFFLNNQFTYRDRRLKGWALISGLAIFYLVCSLGALANVGVGSALFARSHQWWLAGASGALVGSVWNYVMGNLFTWRNR